MPLPYVMPTAPLFYSITMKTEFEPKKVLLTVDVTALVTKEDSPGRSFWDCLCLCNTYNSVLITVAKADGVFFFQTKGTRLVCALRRPSATALSILKHMQAHFP